MDFTKGSDTNAQSCRPNTRGAAPTELILCTWPLNKICGKQEHMLLMTFYKHS